MPGAQLTDKPLYIGLMSGTSLDAIDAVALDFSAGASIIGTLEYPFPDKLRHQLEALVTEPVDVRLCDVGQIDRELANTYAAAVNALLKDCDLSVGDVAAIGCHGQTAWHQPGTEAGFSLQLGNGAALAALTGIAVVNDFRNADIALGGQGAPLVPAFHHAVFADAATDRIVVNIGGIANVTLLPAAGVVTGYDTGPGNTLLDCWSAQHLGKPYDDSGQWAATGTVDSALLETLLTDSYFGLEPPKSTGREYFNADWLHRYLNGQPEERQPADVQATLAELTARTIAQAVQSSTTGGEVYLCGGGARNTDLVQRIARCLDPQTVTTTDALGIDPAWVEAAAFAWLARARLHNQPGNLPAVTGASRPAVLGAIHAP